MKNIIRSLIACVPVSLVAVSIIGITVVAEPSTGSVEKNRVHFPVTTVAASEIQDSVRDAALRNDRGVHRHTYSNVVTQTPTSVR